jgi:drug/metabolite transporter (DMT)-like permease
MGCFFILGGNTIVFQYLRACAYKRCEASKLSVFQYLNTPFQLIYDVLLINSPIYSLQIFGLLIMSAVYTLKIMQIRREQSEFNKM